MTDHVLSERIKPVPLTADEMRRWQTVSRMLFFQAPGFSHYYYKMLSNAGNAEALPVFVDDAELCPRAWTDGVNIVLNRNFYFYGDAAPTQTKKITRSVGEQVFILAHEIVHGIRNDPLLWSGYRNGNTVPQTDGSTKEWDEETMQVSGDYTNNALLAESGIGTVPEDCYYDPEVATSNDFTLDLYGKRYKKKPKRNPQDGDENGPGNGQGQPGQGQNDVMQPGASTQAPGPQAINQTQQQIAVQQALDIQKGQGKLPAGMERLFKDIIEPQIAWIDQVRTLIYRKVGSDGRTWKEPDIAHIGRDLYLPSRSGHSAGWLAIWGDTSGSRSDQDVADQVSEMHGIMEELQPMRLTVLWGDADIAQIDELEEPGDLEKIQPKGGGGTDVDPILAWIKDQDEKPDMLICFTDGEFTWPDEPDFPVLWVLNTDMTPPWGDAVYIKPRR